MDATLRPFFLSALPPTDGERRLALLTVALSALLFAIVVPFAKLPLAQLPVFIALYQAMLVVCDVVTAVLLFGQFAILRSRALLLLAGGYLFTAAMAVVHMLTFPGLFAADGLLGAGTQSTAWLYMFWHAGFPLAVIAYARLPDGGAAAAPRRSILACAGAVLAVAAGLAVLTIASGELMPAIILNNRYTPTMIGVVGTVWLLSLAALVFLWRRRPRSSLDLWLMVVMCAWLFDIALSAVLNGGRYDLGFYAGRLYGLVAASFVLCVLLVHTLRLYARLASAATELDRSNRALDEFAYIVSHDLKEPLRGIHNYASFLQEDYAERLDDEGRGYLERTQRLAERMAALIDRLLAYSRLGTADMPLEDADLDRVLDEVAEDLAPFLVDRGAQLVRHGRLPALRCNALRAGEVFQNLITNAAKYNDKADKQIEVGCDASARPPVFHVRDNGIGIAHQHADSVFRIFKRLHEQDKYGGGSGAGLTIVKKIVERHGGRIWLESAPGAGTTFYFTLSGESP